MNEAEEQNNEQPKGKGIGPTRSFDVLTPGPGRQIGPFRIEKELGRGGMGVVYLAHDTTLGRSVAIKSLPPEVMADRKISSRLEREARLLASLSHPNIAAILVFFGPLFGAFRQARTFAASSGLFQALQRSIRLLSDSFVCGYVSPSLRRRPLTVFQEQLFGFINMFSFNYVYGETILEFAFRSSDFSSRQWEVYCIRSL
jgi:serine/threonine protein kinase